MASGLLVGCQCGMVGGSWCGNIEFSAGKANFSLAVVKNVNISCGLMRTAVALVLVWVRVLGSGFWVLGYGVLCNHKLGLPAICTHTLVHKYKYINDCLGVGIQIV